MNALQVMEQHPGVLLLVAWIKLSLFAGLIARYKHRSFFGFFISSLLLTPIIGLPASIFSRDMRPNIKKRLSSLELETTIKDLIVALAEVEAEEAKH